MSLLATERGPEALLSACRRKAKMLTADAARRIAVNIARLAKLLGKAD
jgi:hypothetical protein